LDYEVRIGRSLVADRVLEVHVSRGNGDTAAGRTQSAHVLDDTVLSVRGVSNLIGVIEIAIAILLALRPISAKASFVGSLGSVATFLLTTSFLLSTPGAVQMSHGLPVLGDAGQFLIKDVVLLGASFWTAAEALAAI
jgi:uncharacterized membrane protein YkgB